MTENRIIVRQTPEGYTATFDGPLGDETHRLFGTRTLPTPFTNRAKAAQVLDDLRAKNPGVRVEFQWGTEDRRQP